MECPPCLRSGGASIMHDMGRREDLQSAVRLSATSRQLACCRARHWRPADVAVRPRVALSINATMQLALAVCSPSRPTRPFARTRRRRRAAELAPREVVGTVRELARNRAVLAMLAVAGMTPSSSVMRSRRRCRNSRRTWAIPMEDTATQRCRWLALPVASWGLLSNPRLPPARRPHGHCAQRCSRRPWAALQRGSVEIASRPPVLRRRLRCEAHHGQREQRCAHDGRGDAGPEEAAGFERDPAEEGARATPAICSAV